MGDGRLSSIWEALFVHGGVGVGLEAGLDIQPFSVVPVCSTENWASCTIFHEWEVQVGPVGYISGTHVLIPDGTETVPIGGAIGFWDGFQTGMGVGAHWTWAGGYLW